MTDPIKGHYPKTKGNFDDDVFREASWEEAEEIAVDMQYRLIQKYGGNSIGIWQSGQLTMEEQWVDNQSTSCCRRCVALRSSATEHKPAAELSLGQRISGPFEQFFCNVIGSYP